MKQVTKSISVNRDVATVFRLWRDFEQYPKFMRNVKSVEQLESGISHWVMAGALGFKVQWDARMTALEENRSVAWESIKGDITTAGHADFTPLDSGERTQITVTMSYELGGLGNIAAHFFFDPDKLLEQDLERAKKYFEQCEGS